MPKKSLTFNGFGGGLNTEADESDLNSEGRGKDEVAFARDIFLDERGKLTCKAPIATDNDLTIASQDSNDINRNLLVHDSKIYNETGVYKMGEDVNWAHNSTYKTTNPSALAINDGILPSPAGFRLNVTSTGKLVLFLGDTAESNTYGDYGWILPSDLGTSINISSIGNYVLHGTDANDDGKYEEQQGGVTGGYIGLTSIDSSTSYGSSLIQAKTKLDADIDISVRDRISSAGYVASPPTEDGASYLTDGTYTDIAAVYHVSSSGYKLGTGAKLNITISGGVVTECSIPINNNVFDGGAYYAVGELLTVDSGDVGGNSGTVFYTAITSAFDQVSATDVSGFDHFDCRKIVADKNGWGLSFRLGASNWDYDYTPQQIRGGRFVLAMPNPALQDIVLGVHLPNAGGLEKFVIVLDCDNQDTSVHYDIATLDSYSKIYEVTSAALIADGADDDYVRTVIPHGSSIFTGANYNEADVRTVHLIARYGGNSPSSGEQILLNEFTFQKTTLSGWSASNFSFLQTNINSKGIESLAIRYTGIYSGSSGVAEIQVINNANIGWNGNIYWQKTDDNGSPSGDQFLLCKVDNADGVIPANDPSESSIAWNTDVVARGVVSIEFDDVPQNSTYLLESGYPEGTKYVDAKWKSAAVVGRQIYIGNVSQPESWYTGVMSTGTFTFNSGAQTCVRSNGSWEDIEGLEIGMTDLEIDIQIPSVGSNSGRFHEIEIVDATTLKNNSPYQSERWGTSTENSMSFYYELYAGDKILKSVIGKPAGFSDKQFIDLEFGGDVITDIQASGDRLLVFSTNMLTVINVAQDIEYIEAAIAHYGVELPRQVCRIGEGVAFVNAGGVYWFDGKEVISLSDTKIDISTFANSTEFAIGFDPTRKLLCVWVKPSNSTIIYYYSFKTNAWVGQSSNIGSLTPHTNVFAGPNTRSYYSVKSVVNGSGSVYYLGSSDTSLTDRDISISTGKLSFGDISRNKKFYKVYINTSGTSNVLNFAFETDEQTYTSSPMITGFNEISLPSTAKGKWIKLYMTSDSAAGDTDIEIGDMSIVYREKIIK